MRNGRSRRSFKKRSEIAEREVTPSVPLHRGRHHRVRADQHLAVDARGEVDAEEGVAGVGDGIDERPHETPALAGEREELAAGKIERHAIDRRRRRIGKSFDDRLDDKMGGGVVSRHAYSPVLIRVQARVRSRSYSGVTGLSKNNRARTSAGG